MQKTVYALCLASGIALIPAHSIGDCSTLMLGTGASVGRWDHEQSIKDQRLPMGSWPTWWLVRTYLQSVGQVCICVGLHTTHPNRKCLQLSWVL